MYLCLVFKNYEEPSLQFDFYCINYGVLTLKCDIAFRNHTNVDVKWLNCAYYASVITVIIFHSTLRRRSKIMFKMHDFQCWVILMSRYAFDILYQLEQFVPSSAGIILNKVNNDAWDKWEWYRCQCISSRSVKTCL